jgi:hypothetical protein
LSAYEICAKIEKSEVETMYDQTLLGILLILSLVAAVLRVRLAKKQGRPNSAFWTVQEFVFPVLLLVALVLLEHGKDIVFGLVMLGLLEELVCVFLRHRAQKKEER